MCLFFFSLFMLSEGASAYERIYKESGKKILNGKIKFTWRMGMRDGAWGMGWDESKCKLVVLVDPIFFAHISGMYRVRYQRSGDDTKKHMVQRQKRNKKKEAAAVIVH